MAVEQRHVDRDEEGMRLDRWFKTHYPDLAFGHLQKLLRTGQVRVDGARAKTNTRLASGQSVRIPPLEGGVSAAAGQTDWDKVERKAGTGPNGSPGIAAASGRPAAPSVRRPVQDDKDAAFLKSITLYEDRDVMVLDKPFGLAVQGGSGTYRHVDGLMEALRTEDGVKPRLVHRIDKDTSGILLVAKSRLAASTLAKTFRSRAARKVYWALVAGVPKPRQGRISTYLAKDDEMERMRVARHGEDEASHAVSYYAVVDQAAQKLAWLSLKPVTGRTHQLRAHAAHIGHPIVGDPKYFDIENWPLPGGLQNRLHLLARRLVIPHPREDRLLDVSAPLPPHMVQSWSVLGFDASQYDPIVDADE